MLREHLKSIIEPLFSNPAVTAYSGRAKQGARAPYVMLHLPNQERPDRLTGPTGEVITHVQIDCIGNTLAQAQDMGEKIVKLLQKYIGLYETHEIAQCTILGEMEDTWSDDVGLSRWIVDVEISHE